GVGRAPCPDSRPKPPPRERPAASPSSRSARPRRPSGRRPGRPPAPASAGWRRCATAGRSTPTASPSTPSPRSPAAAAAAPRPVRVAPGEARHLAELPAELASGRLRFSLLVATARGPWQEVGLLHAGTRLPEAQAEALRFDPSLAAGGIEPVGFVQATRRLAY